MLVPFIQAYDTGDMATAERTRRRDILPFVAWGLALAASVGLLLAPLGEREESCSVPAAPSGAVQQDPEQACRTHVANVSLLQEEGPSVVFIIAIPVVVAVAPLALRRTRWRKNASIAAGVLLLAFSILGAASIGLFYLPSGIASLLASNAPAAPSAPA